MADLTLRGAGGTLVLSGGSSDTLNLGHNGGTVSMAMLLGVGPAGPAGVAGPTGPTGPAGPPGTGSEVLAADL